MKSIVIVFSILMLLFFCCKPGTPNLKKTQRRALNDLLKRSSIAQFYIDNAEIPLLADISDLVSEVKIIPLVEESNNNIRFVFKIICLKNHYAIFDLPSKSIFVFSKDGSFIKTIVKPGRGPDEAIEVSDCWAADFTELEYYDFPLRIIYTTDSLLRSSRKIRGDHSQILYSLARIPKTANYVGYCGYLSNPVFKDSCYQLVLFNSEFKVINTALHYDCSLQGVQVMNTRNHFFQYHDSLRFFYTYNNNIYHVCDSLILPIGKINYAVNEIPVDFFTRTISDDPDFYKLQLSGPEAAQQSAAFKKYAYLQDWIENGSFIHVTSNDSNGWHSSIIDKKTKRSVFTARRLSETKRYKVVFPRLESYDPFSDTFIGCEYGARILKENLLPGFDLIDKTKINPAGLYLFLVKFNNIQRPV